MKKNRSFFKGLIIILSFSVVILGLVIYIQQNGDEDQLGQEDVPPEKEVEPEETVVDEPIKPELPMWYLEGEFELPITGAAGYTSVDQALHEAPGKDAAVLGVLAPGTLFEIREESGDYWRVQSDTFEGWIEHRFAFINLPDVIPSIIYNHTNSYDSRFQSSYLDIPELTGEPLNPMIAFNNRLQKEEFIMPALYGTAKKIFHAQQLALQNGDTLILYETFRPRDLQLLVNESLTQLAEKNEEVAEGITNEPWSMTWFINMNVSNHQRGIAVDLNLASVDELIEHTIGDFRTLNVVSYTEYDTHTPIHELSAESAIFEHPIAAADREGWRELVINSEMTEQSIKLQEYMVEAGFNPLASEWWHFNDVDALEDLGSEAGTGEFHIKETRNSVPLWDEISFEQE